jgi:hypothetical protein
VRVRVIETYTDPVGYSIQDGELVWDRTLGRPYDDVALPPGWMLTSVSVPAIVSLDAEGLLVCRFTNSCGAKGPEATDTHGCTLIRIRVYPCASVAICISLSVAG